MVANRTLIRGGTVLTMDPATPGGLVDVLVEGQVISRIGPSLDVEDALIVDASDMLVIPGFVDTHRHNWQTQLRGIASDWSLPEYLAGIRGTLGPQYQPEDVYAGTLLGITEALNGGVTTILDWAHIMNSPAHADASVHALREFGGRAIFAHSTPNDERIEEWYVDSQLPHPVDIRRVREEWFSSDDGLVTMAMAARGPQHTTRQVSADDWRLARELDLRITVHVGEGAWGMRHAPVRQLHEAGVLGPDTTFVHANCLSDEELELIASSGGSISISPEVELHMGHGHPVTGRALKVGIQPCLSVDVVVVIGGDMFGAMRCLLATERARVNAIAIERREMVERLTLRSEDVLRFATIEGARAVGLDDRVGTITAGKQADIVLIRGSDLNLTPVNNEYAAAVLHAHPGNVDTVFVAGNIVKRSGVLTSIDVARVRQLAEISRDALLARAGVYRGWTPEDIEAWSAL
jgi:5-methylthioadenosine/S-adenosylhomocysteine deaminase